ncbi:MAG: hypothetical protein H7Y60_00610 [Rhodospirillaceae bacterium]|nr:hypothetical protein [Rhodospirillales bacterium]
MKEVEIPVADKDKKTREIEEDGLYEVVSCDFIVDKPGWCKLVYQRRR